MLPHVEQHSTYVGACFQEIPGNPNKIQDTAMFINSILSFLDAMISPVRSAFHWFAQWVPGMKRFAELPLPWLVAWTMLLVLIGLVASDVVAYIFGDEVLRKDYGKTLPIFLVLIPVITVLSFIFTHLLMQKEVSRYPDIDMQWNEGLQQLVQQGIDISDTPIVLVLGAEDGKMVGQLADSIAGTFPVNTSATAGQGLAFLANPNVIYVFANGCNRLSKLSLNRQVASAPVSADRGNPKRGSRVATATLDNDSSMDERNANDREDLGEPIESRRVPKFGGSKNLETLEEDPAMEAVSAPVTLVAGVESKLNAEEQALFGDRLQYLVSLVCKTRYPVCSANGLLVLLPYELVEMSASATQLALQEDMRVLQENLRVRVPAIALVTEMDKHDGFVEMIDRLGLDKVRFARFGKGCETLGEASKMRLQAVVMHAVASFEKRIYELFARAETMRKKTNGKLFSFMARLRQKFEQNLVVIISEGFGQNEPGKDPANEPMFFSGCYFAATGDAPEKQAFVAAVFEKLIENDAGLLEWNSMALKEDQSYHQVANFVMTIGGVALLALLGLAIWVVWNLAAVG